MEAPGSLWIFLTIWASFAQTLRNAAQRHLVTDLGTLGATLVRFLFGLPFALVWCGVVLSLTDEVLPAVSRGFLGWVSIGAIAQIVATALLLRVMRDRNFAVGVAYSKTELIQVALFAAVFLGDPTSPPTILAILLATLGVLMLSPLDPLHRLRSFLGGWTSRTALLGIASGAGFALAAVGYRGGALALGETPFTLAGAYTLVWAMAIQVVVLGGYLALRNPRIVLALVKAWKPSLAAGFLGAAASAGWFTAMAIEPVAHVRTLGLVELLFSMALARRFFRERLSLAELAGMALLTVALVVVTLGT
jgi:drug/metabolite transporter (DMT)-like permease